MTMKTIMSQKQNTQFNSHKGYFAVVCLLLMIGCNGQNDPLANVNEKSGEFASANEVQLNQIDGVLSETKIDNDVVIAVNIGGELYHGMDGVAYQADTLLLKAEKGVIDTVLGSQDYTLFQSYRIGDINFNLPIDNGYYDLVFKFAEPVDLNTGERVFDVYAQGKRVIADLDVKLARDGKINSALVRAVTDVEVTNGQLNIELFAKTGDAILSALVVRKKHKRNSGWQLVWQDEFDQNDGLDEHKWNYELWPARMVNDEDQTYTNRTKNVRLEDGYLIIEAHKENYNDAQYTSARIQSAGKRDFLYGRAEIRAKVPAGQGTWPAVWMMPTDFYRYAKPCQNSEQGNKDGLCNPWPNSGEIDIMEHVGFDMQTIHGTVHNKAYYWRNWQQRKSSIEGKDVDQQFHIYAIEWNEDEIRIFFDDTQYFYYKNEHQGWQSWPYDHPYHIILNVAVGGMWGRAGGPIDDSIFPVKMEIDYVRIYQK